MFKNFIILFSLLLVLLILTMKFYSSEKYTPIQLPTSMDVTVQQEANPTSSSVQISSTIPPQKTRFDITQNNVTPSDDPSPETLLQNDRQYLLPYGIIDKSFIFSIFFPLVSMWFPCGSDCTAPVYSGAASVTSTVISLFDPPTQNFLGFLVLENGQNMSLTTNINKATRISLVPITDGGDVGSTPDEKGGFYLKTADGTSFINTSFGNSGNQIQYSPEYISSTCSKASTFNSIIFANSPQYQNNLTVSYPYGCGPGNNFKGVVMMNNPTAIPPYTMLKNPFYGLMGDTRLYIPNPNQPVSANITQTPFATAYVYTSTVKEQIFTLPFNQTTNYISLTSDTGITTDINSATTFVTATQQENDKVLLFDTVSGAQYTGNQGNVYMYSKPIDPPCFVCTTNGQTEYPYRPVPYKINRIICREKTIDGTGINNYAFSIDATSGLQYAYIKKYLIGLGAVVLSDTQILDDETTMQTELLTSSEAIDEYKNGYQDGYSKGMQMVCAGIPRPSSDVNFSSIVGDVKSVIAVASFLLF